MLSHYVREGVDELDQENLPTLLRLKYHDSITDAKAELGQPEEIGNTFVGFQMHLYEMLRKVVGLRRVDDRVLSAPPEPLK